MVTTYLGPLAATITLAALCLCTTAANATEYSLSLGANSHSVDLDTGDPATDNQDISDTGSHIGFGIKNQYGERGQHFFGVGIDIDQIGGDQLIGYRALDYQFAFNSHIRAGAFFGAASLDTGLPQNGYYTGLNISYQGLFDHLGITLELRHGNGLARDRQLASDPTVETGKPDIFLDFSATALQFSWTF